MARKDKEDELFLTIEDAIDAYIEYGGRDILESRENYEHGYEVKLVIKKNKELKRK